MMEAIQPHQSGSVTLAAIQAAALDLFSDVGYEAASVRQIAQVVGIQPASLYNYYGSKEQILWDICRTAMTELHAAVTAEIDPDDDPVSQLRSFMGVHLRFHVDKRREALVTNRQLRGLSPERYEDITDSRAAYEHRLRAILERGADEGSFTLPDARLVSYALLGLGIHISSWFRDDGPLTREEVIEGYLEFAEQSVTK